MFDFVIGTAILLFSYIAFNTKTGRIDLMEKHFVTFYSPGTFVSETSTKEIAAWDADLAVSMARDIKERHAAKPYGFRFETQVSDGWEPKTVRNSGMYYLGGRLLTIDDIPDTKENETLRWNMSINDIKTVIENTNSWKVTMPFDKNKDTLLEFK
jgi:hypothetical protein